MNQIEKIQLLEIPKLRMFFPPYSVSNSTNYFSRVKNEEEYKQIYPLHYCAQKGDYLALSSWGESCSIDPNYKDTLGQTPIHYAVLNHKDPSAAFKCLEALLKFKYFTKHPDSKKNFINCLSGFEDPSIISNVRESYIKGRINSADTALNWALTFDAKRIVARLVLEGAELHEKVGLTEPLTLIYQNMPETLPSIWDKSILPIQNEYLNYNLKLDFSTIIDNRIIKGKYKRESKYLYHLLNSPENIKNSVIVHPLAKIFLTLKWIKIRKFFYFSVIFHIFWIVLYTALVGQVYVGGFRGNLNKSAYYYKHFNNTSSLGEDESIPKYSCSIYLLVFVLIFNIMVAVKEILHFLVAKADYMRCIKKYPHWILIFVIFLTSYPFRIEYLQEWHYIAASIGMILGWLIVLNQIGHIPRLGIYIFVFKKVVKTFTMFILTFLSILIAFTFSLLIILPEIFLYQNQSKYISYPASLVKIIVMMVGELEYKEIFESKEDNHDEGKESITHFSFVIMGQIIIGAFVIVVVIILCNLLIGLTVWNIQELQNHAKAQIMTNQIRHIHTLESVLLSKKILSILTYFNIKHLVERILLVYHRLDEDYYIEREQHDLKVYGKIFKTCKIIPNYVINEAKSLIPIDTMESNDNLLQRESPYSYCTDIL